MSRELVIERRARALFNKFWKQVGQDPQWLRQVFQDNPDIFQTLMAAFVSSNPSSQFAVVVSAVQEVAKEQARALATQQVDSPPFTLQWVQETLEYQ